MGQFTAFSLSDGIRARQAGQQTRMNRMKMDALQAETGRKQNLRQIAQESTKPTYDVGTYDLEGPNKPTGTEYDPEAHKKGLREGGYTKEAEGLERHLSQMAPEERKQIEFDAKQGAIDAFNADTEVKWESLQNRLEKEAEIAGKEFFPRTFGERQDVINEARAIGDLTGDKAKGKKGQQKVNLSWPGQENPVKGKFDPSDGSYKYEKSPGEWVNAPPNAQITTTAITGSKDEVLGLTKSNVTALNKRIGSDLEAITALEDLIPLIEKTPEAVGMVGAIAESTAGLLGQFGVVGEQMSEMIESDDAIEVRTGLKLLTGQLVPRVTGDSSGRYSDQDLQRVDDVRAGLKAMRNKRQTVKGLNVVLDAIRNGSIRDKYLQQNGRYPTPTEFKKLKGGASDGKSKYSNLWGG